MKEKRSLLCNRIRSAKSWLNRAEDSFANKNDVQGEINLLLAQAELQHLKENTPSFFQKNIHFIAFFTAGIIALGGWGLWYRQPAEVLKTNNLVIPMTKPFESDKIDLLKMSNTQPQTINTVETAEQAITTRAEQQNPVVREEAPAVVQNSFSEYEMRELVRTAGQVLRNNG